MQKQVSKQSLAIVALSILLAIAMALTATFAAFTATNTSVGTITFIGDITYTITSTQTTGDGAVTVTQNNAAGATIVGDDGGNTVTIAFGMTLTGTPATDLAALNVQLAKIQIANGANSPSAVFSISIAETENEDDADAVVWGLTENTESKTGFQAQSSKVFANASTYVKTAAIAASGTFTLEGLFDETEFDLSKLVSGDDQVQFDLTISATSDVSTAATYENA